MPGCSVRVRGSAAGRAIAQLGACSSAERVHRGAVPLTRCLCVRAPDGVGAAVACCCAEWAGPPWRMSCGSYVVRVSRGGDVRVVQAEGHRCAALQWQARPEIRP